MGTVINHQVNDGVGGGEGAFSLCTLWSVSSLLLPSTIISL